MTGASRGFGLEVTRALAAGGWDVITLSRSRAGALDQIPFVTQLQGDVASVDLAGLMAMVGDRPVELLVNNAGVGGTATELAALSADELETSFAVNVWGPARLSGALVPNLRLGKRPLVINVSTRLASLTLPGFG